MSILATAHLRGSAPRRDGPSPRTARDFALAPEAGPTGSIPVGALSPYAGQHDARRGRTPGRGVAGDARRAARTSPLLRPGERRRRLGGREGQGARAAASAAVDEETIDARARSLRPPTIRAAATKGTCPAFPAGVGPRPTRSAAGPLRCSAERPGRIARTTVSDWPAIAHSPRASANVSSAHQLRGSALPSTTAHGHAPRSAAVRRPSRMCWRAAALGTEWRTGPTPASARGLKRDNAVRQVGRVDRRARSRGAGGRRRSWRRGNHPRDGPRKVDGRARAPSPVYRGHGLRPPEGCVRRARRRIPASAGRNWGDEINAGFRQWRFERWPRWSSPPRTQAWKSSRTKLLQPRADLLRSRGV